jgi:hypothetical protein
MISNLQFPQFGHRPRLTFLKPAAIGKTEDAVIPLKVVPGPGAAPHNNQIAGFPPILTRKE